MKHATIITLLVCICLMSTSGQTVYTLTPNSKGNQIELSVANQSATQVAEVVEVKATKHPLFITYASEVQTVNAIAPNHEASVTFTFDVGRAAVSGKKDTLEFHIGDRSSSLWKKFIVVDYAAPEEFKLEQNYPNPFNPSTTIQYQLPVESRVSLKVYDLLGREVVTLLNEQQGAGFKDVTLNAMNVASGVYFYRIIAQPLNGGPTFSKLKKLMVLK